MIIKRVLIVDHYDSFVHILADYVRQLGGDVLVKFYDTLSQEEIEHYNPTHIILSPGPKHPKDASETFEILRKNLTIPTLGVCLGHQIIGSYFGMIIEKNYPAHGREEAIFYKKEALFYGISSPFLAGRYHSLSLCRDKIPENIEIIAYNKENIIMGIKHKHYPIWGVQFHPESFLTPQGIQLIKNFLTDGLCF